MTFLDVAKTYFRVSVKKLLPELKRLQAAFLHKCNQIKQERSLNDLMEAKATLEDFNSYNDFLTKFHPFLKETMKTFKQSIKDLIRLFRVAEKEELKQFSNEYTQRSEQEGLEAADVWFTEQADAVRVRLLQETRNALLVEEAQTLPFLIELL